MQLAKLLLINLRKVYIIHILQLPNITNCRGCSNSCLATQCEIRASREPSRSLLWKEKENFPSEKKIYQWSEFTKRKKGKGSP